MTQSLPADRTFVDLQRKIVDSWLGVFKRLEDLLPLLTPANIATLKKAFADAASGADEQVVAAFAVIKAFNEGVQTEGGSITATQASDILNILAGVNASFVTDRAAKSLSLQVGGHYATIAEAGGRIANLGMTSASNQGIGGDKIFMAPVQVPCRRTFAAFTFNKGNANTPNTAWGIYADAGSRPGNQLWTTIFQTSGGTGDVALPLSITLSPGLYWLAGTVSGNVQVLCVNGGTACMGLDSANNVISGFSRNATFNGLLTDEAPSQWSSINISGAMPVMSIS